MDSRLSDAYVVCPYVDGRSCCTRLKLTLPCKLLSFAVSLFKQCGPRSGPTERQFLCGSRLFYTIPERILGGKFNFEKVSRHQQSMKKLPSQLKFNSLLPLTGPIHKYGS